MKKRLLVSLILILLLSTYNIQNKFKINSIFPIEKMIIENNILLKDQQIKNELSYLYGKNLFFLNMKKLEIELGKIEFIESFEIKRIYPNVLKIKVFEKKPIAILQNKKRKRYFTKKGELIEYSEFEEFKDLPIIFGDKESFQIFYSNLLNIYFPLKEIKYFYLFDSKRWDLVTFDEQTIKLPIKNYEKSLKNFMTIKQDKNFRKFKIFDYRIKNQLILK